MAEQLLAGIDYDGYFLEYDTDRAGGLEPLRFLPKGRKRVVVGLVTSKTGALEKKDDIKRRLDEAAKYAPLDQLCLSPQCGFASTEEGNVLTEEEQWAKLRMIVDIAREVWGRDGALKGKSASRSSPRSRWPAMSTSTVVRSTAGVEIGTRCIQGGANVLLSSIEEID